MSEKMTTTAGASLWEIFEHTPSMTQRGFMKYLTATLVDLVVLGLFVEYWEHRSPPNRSRSSCSPPW